MVHIKNAFTHHTRPHVWELPSIWAQAQSPMNWGTFPTYELLRLTTTGSKVNGKWFWDYGRTFATNNVKSSILFTHFGVQTPPPAVLFGLNNG